MKNGKSEASEEKFISQNEMKATEFGQGPKSRNNKNFTAPITAAESAAHAPAVTRSGISPIIAIK